MAVVADRVWQKIPKSGCWCASHEESVSLVKTGTQWMENRNLHQEVLASNPSKRAFPCSRLQANRVADRGGQAVGRDWFVLSAYSIRHN